jgi:hypothetical protein
LLVACVVEGKTEYFTVPKLVGRLGHAVVLTLKFDGGNNDECPWESLIDSRVVPRVIGAAEKGPDKILVVIDREGRNDCSPELGEQALQIIHSGLADRNLTARVGIVVCDRRFENLLMADTELVDNFKFLLSRFSDKIGQHSDGKNVVRLFNECCPKTQRYDKLAHGIALARNMAITSQAVQSRSRSLRKLVKELSD